MTLLILALIFPLSASAQWVEAVELGMLGRWGVYDGAVGLDAAVGWGPRVGIHLGERWIVEGDWTFQNPRATGTITFESNEYERPRTSHDLFGGRLLYDRPLGDRIGLLFGLGLQYARYKGSPRVATSGAGGGALLGLRARLTEVLSLRLEATVYQVRSDPDPAVPRPSTRNGGFQVGLAYTFRGRGRIVELPPPPPDTVIVEVPPPPPDTVPEGLLTLPPPLAAVPGESPPSPPGAASAPRRTSPPLRGCPPITGGEPFPWLRRTHPR
jgi:hypothetical protein